MLSKNSSVRIQETIQASDLIDLYQDKLGMDISSFFNDTKEIRLLSCSESGLLYFDPIIAGDKAFYETLQKHENYYHPARPEFFTAKKYSDNSKVLEIGCGTGNFSDVLESSEYLGLELNPGAVKAACEKNINVKNILLDEQLDSSSERYDTVCAFQVLEHVDNIGEFIELTVSACKTNGHIIFSLPSEDSFLQKAKNHVLNLPPHHLTLWKDQVFHFIADKHNLQIVELKHEEMEDIHKAWFFKVMVRSLLDKVLLRPACKIDLTATSVYLDKLSMLIGILIKPIGGIFGYPKGHTVTVVYKKSE